MNVPGMDRSILRMHIAAIAAKSPLKIIGLLLRGNVGHVLGDAARDFLAEEKPGLSVFGLAGSEIDLADKLGRPAGIVLVGALRDRQAEEFPRIVDPI